MRIWRNWQTRMVQVAPPRCKFISVTISCKLWMKRYAPPRFSTLNRVKIQRKKLNMHPWRNWQTRMVQVHIFERKCRFNSCRVHQTKIIRILLRLEKGSDLLFILNNNEQGRAFVLSAFCCEIRKSVI